MLAMPDGKGAPACAVHNDTARRVLGMIRRCRCLARYRRAKISLPHITDICLQHIGTKGSGSPLLSPCGWRLRPGLPCPGLLPELRGDPRDRPDFSRFGRRGESRRETRDNKLRFWNSIDPPPPGGGGRRLPDGGGGKGSRCSGVLPLRRLRRHLPLAGEDRGASYAASLRRT